MQRTSVAVAALALGAWEEAEPATFGAAWDAELAELPIFTESEFYVVTGLLLPIWRRLPNEGCRVYRLQTDAGERVIGRQVTPAWVAQAVGCDAPTLAPHDAWNAVFDEGAVLHLADGLSIRRATVVNAARVELGGFSDGMVDRLKATGLVSEIIAWKLRLFVPTGSAGPAILGQILDRHPLARVADRVAA